MAFESSKSIARVARDPLLVFLAIGLLLFLLELFLDSDDSKTIELSKAEIEGIAAQWLDQMGRKPLPDELAGLIDERAQEAMLIREAQRLGLAADDVIIHRRLIQKLRFLVEDAAVVEPASKADLQAYFHANLSRYEQAASVSFSHVFFSADSDRATPNWTRLLDELNAGGQSERIGESFMLGRHFKNATRRRVAEDFGDQFAASIHGIDADQFWQGPLKSRYGLHLVRIDEVTPKRQADFDAILNRIRGDFDLERRDEAFRTYLTQLREEYTFVLP